jgi:hypothetical protein
MTSSVKAEFVITCVRASPFRSIIAFWTGPLFDQREYTG